MSSKKQRAGIIGSFFGSFLLNKVREKHFYGILAVGFYACGIALDFPLIAMWIGFLFASYSVIANDSIQTLGTFIASNRDIKWWIMWLFVSVIFVCTVGFSWVQYDGDITFQRLTSKGFTEAPDTFSYLQIAAPLFLLLLTRLKIPVSTTFLILSCFTTSSSSIGDILSKSVSGYVIAFLLAIFAWSVVGKLFGRAELGKKCSWRWRGLQWLSTGVLWSVWLMQDASNIAVFLPRQLDPLSLIAVLLIVVTCLGLLVFKRGEKIQEIVENKNRISETKQATAVDFVYAIILLVFKFVSNIPMSTTWVFIGLLAGREFGMTLSSPSPKSQDFRTNLKRASFDFLYVSLGLVISVVLAVAGNPVLRMEFLGF